LKEKEWNIKDLLDKLFKESSENNHNRKRRLFYENECYRLEKKIKKLRKDKSKIRED